MTAIDRNILREQLGEHADVEGTLRDLAPIFLAHTQACLVRLRDAAERFDHRAVGRLAHTLKGSAATLGATDLSLCCAALCKAAQSQNAHDVTRSMERVTSSFTSVSSELADHLASAGHSLP